MYKIDERKKSRKKSIYNEMVIWQFKAQVMLNYI